MSQAVDIRPGEYEDVMPDMSDEEYEALKRSIEEDGLRHPIEVTEDGTIVDGHHRYRACRELDTEPEITVVEDATVERAVRANFTRRDHSSGEKKAVVKWYLQVHWEGDRTQKEVAEDLGVDPATVTRAKQDLEDDGTELSRNFVPREEKRQQARELFDENPEISFRQAAEELPFEISNETLRRWRPEFEQDGPDDGEAIEYRLGCDKCSMVFTTTDADADCPECGKKHPDNLGFVGDADLVERIEAADLPDDIDTSRLDAATAQDVLDEHETDDEDDDPAAHEGIQFLDDVDGLTAVELEKKGIAPSEAFILAERFDSIKEIATADLSEIDGIYPSTIDTVDRIHRGGIDNGLAKIEGALRACEELHIEEPTKGYVALLTETISNEFDTEGIPERFSFLDKVTVDPVELAESTPQEPTEQPQPDADHSTDDPDPAGTEEPESGETAPSERTEETEPEEAEELPHDSDPDSDSGVTEAESPGLHPRVEELEAELEEKEERIEGLRGALQATQAQSIDTESVVEHLDDALGVLDRTENDLPDTPAWFEDCRMYINRAKSEVEDG